MTSAEDLRESGADLVRAPATVGLSLASAARAERAASCSYSTMNKYTHAFDSTYFYIPTPQKDSQIS